MLAFIRPHANVVDYELLPYHRYGETNYTFLGRIYGLKDFAVPEAGSLVRLMAIIEEAFGRSSPGASVTR